MKSKKLNPISTVILVILCLLCLIVFLAINGSFTPKIPLTPTSELISSPLPSVTMPVTPTFTPELPTDTPEPTEDPIIMAYRIRMSRYLNACADASEELARLNKEAFNFPSVMKDQDWNWQITAQLSALRGCTSDLYNENPPEKFMEVQDYLNKLQPEAKSLMENYLSGIEKLDPDLLEKAVKNMNNVRYYIQKARELMPED